MSLKEKAEKRRALRESRKHRDRVIERKPLDTVGNEIDQYAQDRAKIAVAQAAQPKIQAVDFNPAQAFVQNEKGLSPNAGKIKTNPSVYPTAQATVQNEKGIIPKEAAKPELSPWEKMLEDKRQRYIQEKTDALKMQKYHSMGNILKSIGQMGGATIGGAIGGNVLDSMPNVGEYQQSRGYIQAFEDAKRATERLDKLDDTEFTLAYNKAQRDEEREYQAAMKESERTYNYLIKQEERRYNEERDALKREWELADAETKAEIADRMQKRKEEHEEKMAKIRHEYKMTEIESRKNGSNGGKKENFEYITYDGGTRFMIPKNLYRSMKLDAIKEGKEFEDGEPVTWENADQYLRTDHDFVSTYASGFGYNPITGEKYREGEDPYTPQITNPTKQAGVVGKKEETKTKQSALDTALGGLKKKSK